MPSKIKLPIFLISILLFVYPAHTIYALEIPPQPANPVVDLANIINAGVEAKINTYLRELKNKTTAQVAVLTIKSLEGQNLEEFSISIAHDKWKLGLKDRDNGVLLVIALNDRKYRIEVGYGLEGVLPDSLVGDIGRQYLVPNFRKGDYSAGIYSTAVVISNIIASDAGVKITGLPMVRKRTPETKKRTSGPFGKIISLLFFLVMVIVFIRNPRSFLAILLLSSMGGRRGHWGGSGGGFGSGGFGGFGGGGGGFGGGGASGGW